MNINSAPLQEDIEFLEHFGVKGMKWGVRNEDDPATQIKRNAKAEKFTNKASAYQKQIDTLNNVQPSTYRQKQNIRHEKVKLSELKKQALLDAEAKKKGELSSKQKKVLKGAAYTAGVIAAYGLYRATQSGDLNRTIYKGKAFLLNKEIPYRTNQKLAASGMSADQLKRLVVAPINPSFGTHPGSFMNCRRCTFAYELRRRGYDVSATRTTNAFGQNVFGVRNALTPGEKPFPTSKLGIVLDDLNNKRKGVTETPFTKYASKFVSSSAEKQLGVNPIKDAGVSHISSSIFNSLSSQPNGARGELSVIFGHGGAHSVAWEIINGKPVVFDTQSRKVFKNASEMASDKSYFSIMHAAYTRLDNIDLNMDFLMKWVKDA